MDINKARQLLQILVNYIKEGSEDELEYQQALDKLYSKALCWQTIKDKGRLNERKIRKRR